MYDLLECVSVCVCVCVCVCVFVRVYDLLECVSVCVSHSTPSANADYDLIHCTTVRLRRTITSNWCSFTPLGQGSGVRGQGSRVRG